MKLEIAHREASPGIAVVTLAGRLMLGPESAEVEQRVASLLSEGYRKIVVDLSKVTHIDSTGIGYCIASLNRTMQSGAKLHMAGAAGQVREAFRVTRLDKVFRFFDQLDQAQAALQ